MIVDRKKGMFEFVDKIESPWYEKFEASYAELKMEFAITEKEYMKFMVGKEYVVQAKILAIGEGDEANNDWRRGGTGGLLAAGLSDALVGLRQ